MKKLSKRFIATTAEGLKVITPGVTNPQQNYASDRQEEVKSDTVTPKFSIEDDED